MHFFTSPFSSIKITELAFAAAGTKLFNLLVMKIAMPLNEAPSSTAQTN